MTDVQTPTPDERLIAALSHITVLLPFWGAIATIFIWLSQREKSGYVAFQSLQALAYHLVMIFAWFVGMGIYMCVFFTVFLGTMIGAATESFGSSEVLIVLFNLSPFLILGVFTIFGLAFIVYGVIGAINAFQGKPFRYIFIADRVERFMQSGTEATPAP